MKACCFRETPTWRFFNVEVPTQAKGFQNAPRRNSHLIRPEILDLDKYLSIFGGRTILHLWEFLDYDWGPRSDGYLDEIATPTREGGHGT